MDNNTPKEESIHHKPFENEQREDKSTTSLIENNQEFRVYPSRHLVTAGFIFGRIGGAMQATLVNPISNTLSKVQGKSPLTINLTSLLFLLLNPVSSFPANQVLDSWGLATGFRIGCILIAIGCAIRMLVNSSQTFVIIASIISGLGNPFILNGISKISANWYSPNSRQIVTTVIVMSFIIISAGVGVIPGLLFKEQKKETDDVEFSKGKSITQNLFLIILIATLAVVTLGALFIRSKPPTPPSMSSSMARVDFKEGLRSLIKNCNWILICLAFAFLTGAFMGMAPSFSNIVVPFGFGPFQVSIILVFPLAFGIPGAIITNFLIHKYRKYKLIVLFAGILSLVSMGIFILALYSEKMAFVCISFGFSGMFLVPLVPVLIELCSEVAFPVAEGAAAGFMDSFGKIMAFGIGSILSEIVTGNSKTESLWGMGVLMFCIAIGIIFMFFTKEDLRKLQADLAMMEKSKLAEIKSTDSKNDRHGEDLKVELIGHQKS